MDTSVVVEAILELLRVELGAFSLAGVGIGMLLKVAMLIELKSEPDAEAFDAREGIGIDVVGSMETVGTADSVLAELDNVLITEVIVLEAPEVRTALLVLNDEAADCGDVAGEGTENAPVGHKHWQLQGIIAGAGIDCSTAAAALL